MSGNIRITTAIAQEDRLDELMEQARLHQDGAPEEALSLARQALQLAEERQLRHKVVQAQYRIGQALQSKGCFIEALGAYEKSMLQAQDLCDDTLLADLSGAVGEVMMHQGVPDRALTFFLRALNLREKETDLSGVCSSHNHLGVLYTHMAQYDNALEQFRQARTLSETLKDRRLTALTLKNMGRVHARQEQYAQAREYLQHALEEFEAVESVSGTLEALFELGELCELSEMTDEALRYLERARDLARSSGKLHLQAGCALALGRVYGCGPDLDAAYSELAQGLTLARHIHSNDIILRAYRALSDLFARRSDHRQALEYFQKYSDLKDELHMQAGRNRLEEIRLSFLNTAQTDEKPVPNKEDATREITAQRDQLTRAYEELRLQGEKLNAVFNNAVVGISIIDRFGQYTFVNGYWASMLGYSVEEVYTLKNIKVTHPEDAAESFNRFIDLIEGRTGCFTMRKRYLRKDGSSFWGQLSSSPIHDKGGNVQAVVGIIVDIDEQMRNERILQQLEKKNAALALAVTANHEINQPLQILQSNLEMFLLDFAESNLNERQQRYLSAMHTAVQRISGILDTFKDGESLTFDQYVEDTPMVVFNRSENPQ